MEKPKSPETSGKPEFVISRTFAAPRGLVWKSFTDPERMKSWWGHKGSKVVCSKMDFRVGGTYHYGLKSPEGPEMWGKLTYREIAGPEKLVYDQSFSDPEGEITRHPLAPAWPRVLLTTFTLGEAGGKTALTIRWVPVNPTEEETETFKKALDGCRQGWTGTLDQLEEYLENEKLKS